MKDNSNPDVKVFLIGNKADLEESRVVTKERAQKYKEDIDIELFLETSALTGYNTQGLFVEAAKTLYGDYKKYQNPSLKTGEKIKFNNDEVKKSQKKGDVVNDIKNHYLYFKY